MHVCRMCFCVSIDFAGGEDQDVSPGSPGDPCSSAKGCISPLAFMASGSNEAFLGTVEDKLAAGPCVGFEPGGCTEYGRCDPRESPAPVPVLTTLLSEGGREQLGALGQTAAA